MFFFQYVVIFSYEFYAKAFFYLGVELYSSIQL